MKSSDIRVKIAQAMLTGSDMASLLQQVEAAIEYLRRKNRISHPSGKCDNGGRWYPFGKDEQVMASVRAPSREWPWSYMHACRTVGHCARLYDIDEQELRGIVRAINKGIDKTGNLAIQLADLEKWIASKQPQAIAAKP